jgi:G3E family GTPase
MQEPSNRVCIAPCDSEWDYVLVETSGVTDPSAVISALDEVSSTACYNQTKTLAHTHTHTHTHMYTRSMSCSESLIMHQKFGKFYRARLDSVVTVVDCDVLANKLVLNNNPGLGMD